MVILTLMLRFGDILKSILDDAMEKKDYVLGPKDKK